jgi:hypothetical protein
MKKIDKETRKKIELKLMDDLIDAMKRNIIKND